MRRSFAWKIHIYTLKYVVKRKRSKIRIGETYVRQVSIQNVCSAGSSLMFFRSTKWLGTTKSFYLHWNILIVKDNNACYWDHFNTAVFRIVLYIEQTGICFHFFIFRRDSSDTQVLWTVVFMQMPHCGLSLPRLLFSSCRVWFRRT